MSGFISRQAPAFSSTSHPSTSYSRAFVGKPLRNRLSRQCRATNDQPTASTKSTATPSEEPISLEHAEAIEATKRAMLLMKKQYEEKYTLSQMYLSKKEPPQFVQLDHVARRKEREMKEICEVCGTPLYTLLSKSRSDKS